MKKINITFLIQSLDTKQTFKVIGEYKNNRIKFIDPENNTNYIIFHNHIIEYYKKGNVDMVTLKSIGLKKARQKSMSVEEANNLFDKATSDQVDTVIKATAEEKAVFKEMIEDLVGTRAALVLDQDKQVLGKVPVSELQSTIKSLNSGINAVIFDGAVDKDLVSVSEKAKVKFLVGMSSDVKDARLTILTTMDL